MKFIEDILPTWTVIFSFLTAITLIIVSNSERKEKKKKFFSIAFIVSIISACLLVFNGIKERIEKNKNSANDSLMARKSDTSLINIAMIKMQDSVIKLQQDSIKNNTINLLSAYGQLNVKNDSLINKQEEINQTQRKANNLQHELYNQVTGGNSVPLISSLQIFFSYEDPSKGLIFSIFNPGKYPINNISISYFHELEKKPTISSENLGSFQITFSQTKTLYEGGLTNLFLAARQSHVVLIDSLKYDTTDLLDVKWHINVSWRNVEYTCIIKDAPPHGLVRRRVLEEYYEYNGKIYKKREIIAAIQKDLR